MSTQDRFLQVLLRVVGTAGLLAIPFVMVPYSWMDAIHQGLGMGQLPDAPVVGYLARSASAFYAILGGLLWTVSFDLRRHRMVLSYLGFAVILFGVAMLAVDFGQGMPIWWSLAEGPFNVAFGVAFVWLSWRMDKPGRLSAFRRWRSLSRSQGSGGPIGDDGATTWILFEFLGGPSDGKSVQGALGDGGDAERYYLFTNHGTVGHRFKVASEYAVEILAHEKLKVEVPHHFQPHYYVVTERLEEGDEIWVRATYQPGCDT
jgi:hypothetical protein